jgi:hypothetical protein
LRPLHDNRHLDVVIKEAESFKEPSAQDREGRIDLRDLALVTIDGEDYTITATWTFFSINRIIKISSIFTIDRN